MTYLFNTDVEQINYMLLNINSCKKTKGFMKKLTNRRKEKQLNKK